MKPVLTLIAMVIVFNLMVGISDAQSPIVIDADTQYAYAESRYEKKDYLSSIVEFERFINFFREDPRVHQAVFNIGMSWFHGGRYGDALNVFDTIIQDHEMGDLVEETYFMAAKCHVLSGNPLGGEIQLENLNRLSQNTDTKDRAYNEIGWIRVESGKWAKADTSFKRISDKNRDQYKVGTISKGLTNTQNIPKKNPTLAGALSIVPGAGFLYCGRYRDAFISFLLNGGFIYAAYEAFDDDKNALGGLVSFVGFGFYAGNIYGSVSSAHKFNRNADKRFVRDLKEQVQPGFNLSLIYDAQSEGVGVALQAAF